MTLRDHGFSERLISKHFKCGKTVVHRAVVKYSYPGLIHTRVALDYPSLGYIQWKEYPSLGYISGVEYPILGCKW